LTVRTTALNLSINFLSGQTTVKTGGIFDVAAAIQLGRASLSKHISKNVYERFLFSRGFHSLPSLKAASPADLA